MLSTTDTRSETDDKLREHNNPFLAVLIAVETWEWIIPSSIRVI